MSRAVRSVVVVGGYGGFGRRLVHLLAKGPVERVFVAGRTLARAQALCMELGERFEPVALDRSKDCSALLADLAPDVLIDAAGPFQLYGAAPYGLAQICIEQGICYLDLADGREFVCGIDRLNERALAQGVAVLSGMSSVPALSGAVIAELSKQVPGVTDIEIGITPAGGVMMGPSVVRAILSYAGRPVEVLEDGVTRVRYCWTDLRTRRLSLGPGDRLNRRRFSLCDVPDLELWPKSVSGVRTVRFGAALEPAVNHMGVFCLAWLVRLGVLKGAGFMTPFLQALAPWMPAGVRKGGMYVSVSGTNAQGERASAIWTLIADGDHGPNIPAMACAAMVDRMVRGHMPEPGARAATDELALTDFEPIFSQFDIRTDVSPNQDKGMED